MSEFIHKQHIFMEQHVKIVFNLTHTHTHNSQTMLRCTHLPVWTLRRLCQLDYFLRLTYTKKRFWKPTGDTLLLGFGLGDELFLGGISGVCVERVGYRQTSASSNPIVYVIKDVFNDAINTFYFSVIWRRTYKGVQN